MFAQRLFRYPGMIHQAKDVEMGMKMRQRIADQFIARDLHDLVVIIGIESRDSRLAQSLPAAAELGHQPGGLSQPAQALFAYSKRSAAGAFRLQQQAKFVQLVEAPARDLRRRAVADE